MLLGLMCRVFGNVARFAAYGTETGIWVAFRGDFRGLAGWCRAQPEKSRRCYSVLETVLRPWRRCAKCFSQQGGSGAFRGAGRFRNHDRAIPEPRGSDSGTAKLSWTGAGGLPRLGCHRNHDRKRDHRFMGQSTTAAGGEALAALPQASAGYFICDLPWAVPKDDMASMEHPLFTLATRPDRRILRYAHGAGDDRGDAVGEGARHDPRQGRADLLRQPADGGAERRAGGRRRRCT